MSVLIPEEGERLSLVLSELVTAIAAIPADQFQQDGGPVDVFHEATIAYAEADEEADESAHLAFSVTALDSPVGDFDRQRPGNMLRTTTSVGVVLSYRLRDHTDGNEDGRMCLRACWQICRVIVHDVGGWTGDNEVSVALTNRGRLLSRNGSWLRYEVRFDLSLSEVL